MVLVNPFSSIEKKLELNTYTLALANFLLGKSLSRNSSILKNNNADEISRNIFYALQKNDKKLFSNLYEEISRRKPKPESDWVYNDILLFSLVLGVSKFNFDKAWILDVLKIKLEHSQDENKSIAQSYIDICNNNLESKNNHILLTLVMKYHLGLPLGSLEYINAAVYELSQNAILQSKNIFLELISISAFNVILLSKGLANLERQKEVENFIKEFDKRINQFANFIWFLGLVAILAGLAAFVIYYFGADPQQAEYIDRILQIASILGFGGIFSYFWYKKAIIDFLKRPFYRFYGYTLDKHSKDN